MACGVVMTSEDIERIVICRGIIDKHRAFNKARVEVIETATSIADAKAIIEAKVDATAIVSDISVKPIQEIKSIIEEERTKSTLEMYRILKEQGFESFGSFKEWHDKINLEYYKECNPISGECSGCPDEETPSCLVHVQNILKTESCQGRSNPLNDWAYKIQLILDTNGTTDRLKITKDGLSYIVCPIGKGYYIVEKDRIKSDARIDFGWKA